MIDAGLCLGRQKGVMLFLFLGWCFRCEMAIYSDVLCGWDDEATRPWVHITVGRSIPIDIPDLASRIPVAYHDASGSFGGNGKKPYSHGL